MDNKGRVRGPNYTDELKRQLVAESFEAGVTVPMVSKRHNVPTSRIYSWRQDTRFHAVSVAEPDFTAVEVVDAPDLEGGGHGRTDIHIEITLENGRKISICNGVDADFVLELARGLAA